MIRKILSKRWWESRTMWANVITTLVGILGVVSGADWIKEHPQAVAAIATAVGVLNIVLRSITKGPVTMALMLCLVPSAVGQIQLMPAEKEQRLRAFIPRIDDVSVLNDKIRQATLYTEDEMPPMHQRQLLYGGSGLTYTVFDSVYNQVNGSRLPTNMNREFPWGVNEPGGTHMVPKDRKYEFRFLWLPPKSDNTVWPIVAWKGPLERSTRINMPVVQRGYRWIFPVDTIVGEVLLKNFTDGRWATYEVRMRLREHDGWSFERYVPDIQLPQFMAVKQERLTNRHPREKAFDSTATTYVLPPVSNAYESLTQAKFVPAIGTDRITPTALDDDNIVPRNYAAHFLKNCNDCHTDTLRSATAFEEREWYDFARGSADGIFSVMPFTRQGELRPDLVSAGMVEWFDSAKHSPEMYTTLDEFNNDPSPNPRITNARVIGGP